MNTGRIMDPERSTKVRERRKTKGWWNGVDDWLSRMERQSPWVKEWVNACRCGSIRPNRSYRDERVSKNKWLLRLLFPRSIYLCNIFLLFSVKDWSLWYAKTYRFLRVSGYPQIITIIIGMRSKVSRAFSLQFQLIFIERKHDYDTTFQKLAFLIYRQISIIVSNLDFLLIVPTPLWVSIVKSFP